MLLSMKALFKFKDFFDSGEKVCQQVELCPAEARRVRQLEILGCLGKEEVHDEYESTTQTNNSYHEDD